MKEGASAAVLAAIAEEYGADVQEPSWVRKLRITATRPEPLAIGGTCRKPKVVRPLGAYITREEAIEILAFLEAR